MTANRRNGTLPSATAAKKRALLERLAEHGSLARAAEEAGVSIRTTRWWRQRSPAFADRYDEALAHGEAVQLAEYERLMEQRIRAGAKDQQSAILCMFRVKRLDGRYRDNANVNVLAQGPVAISLGLDPTPGPGLASGAGGMPAVTATSTDPSTGEDR